MKTEKRKRREKKSEYKDSRKLTLGGGDVDASIGLKIVSAYKMMACSWKFEIDLQFRIIFFV